MRLLLVTNDMKTPLQEGTELASRYMEDWKKIETPDQEDELVEGILELRKSECIRTILLCTGGPHLELSIIANEDNEFVVAFWTYKDWGTCDRWFVPYQDLELLEKIFEWVTL